MNFKKIRIVFELTQEQVNKMDALYKDTSMESKHNLQAKNIILEYIKYNSSKGKSNESNF